MKYLPYLIIGAIFSVLISTAFYSCSDKVDYDILCDYWYINNSKYPVRITAFNSQKQVIKTFDLKTQDSILIPLKGEGGVGPFQFDTYVEKQADSVVIIFADAKTLSYSKGEGILYLRNYSIYEVDKFHQVLKYYITDVLHNQAK